MKTNFLKTILWLFLLTSAITAQSVPTADLTLDKGVAAHNGIDSIYKRFSEAYRTLNPSAVAELYTEDALYLEPNNDVKRGREDILANFTGFFNSVKNKGGKVGISFQILERRTSGDLGYDAGIFSLTVTDANGASQTNRGKFVVITRQMKNGEWRFGLDTYNEFPRPKAVNQKVVTSPN